MSAEADALCLYRACQEAGGAPTPHGRFTCVACRVAEAPAWFAGQVVCWRCLAEGARRVHLRRCRRCRRVFPTGDARKGSCPDCYSPGNHSRRSPVPERKLWLSWAGTGVRGSPPYDADERGVGYPYEGKGGPGA